MEVSQSETSRTMIWVPDTSVASQTFLRNLLFSISVVFSDHEVPEQAFLRVEVIQEEQFLAGNTVCLVVSVVHEQDPWQRDLFVL